MALDFVSTPGGLFPRIGKILHVAFTLSPYQATLPAFFDTINSEYESTLLYIGGGVTTQANSLVRASSGVMGFAAQAALQTIVGMVRADTPSQSRTDQAAMAEVIRQMKLQGKTVQASTIASTATSLTGTVGNGVVVITTKRGDGLVQENTIAETLRLVCTRDAYTGGQTAGQELFGLTGAPILTSTVWDYDWPTGSAASLQASAVSSAVDGNTTTQMLTNGDMESWTTDVIPELNNWVLEDGVWGTDIQRDITVPNGGTYCTQFLATANDTEIYQEFGTTDGTIVTPAGELSYIVNMWLRKVSGTISAGVLEVALVNDAGTILQDDQGVNNSFTVTLSTLTTSYVAYSGAFRLNSTPPDVIRLRLRISTALAGATFVVDDICMTPTTAMYVGGPSFAVFSGSTAFVAGDGWNLANTNNQGGASNLGTFQTGFERLFSMRQNGFLLPSLGSPNLPNSWITA